MTRVGILLYLVSIATQLGAQEASASGDIRVARYTTLSPQPTAHEIHPLESIITVRFPRNQIQTVGEAVEHLLLRTGYRLDSTDTAIQRILSLPLPEVHRRLGPCGVRVALQSLMGDAFLLKADALRRVVSYAAIESSKTVALPLAKLTPDRIRKTPAIEATSSLPSNSNASDRTASLQMDEDIEVIVVPLKD